MQTRSFWSLDDISDERLVTGLKELMAASVRTEARIVAHLAEVDARRLHLEDAPSLFEYCHKYLGLSDNQAYYRIAAARVARRFPIVFELLERHEIHLVNIAPLSKYLTEENHRDLLREGGRLSKRELLRLLARRAPRPDALSHIRKLTPAAGAAAAGPTGSLEPLSESSYRLQLNTSEALKGKLELARDLMSHVNPSGDLAVVVERAVDLLIDKLHSRRFGQIARRQRPLSERKPEASTTTGTLTPAGPAPGAASLDRSNREHHFRTRAGVTQPDSVATKVGRPSEQRQSPERTRAHIAHETRRRLLERDGLGCSHVGAHGQRCRVGAHGQRCRARAFLQIHHDQAWAKGGPDSLDNLRLLCAAHNQRLAEQEYGTDHVRRAIEQRRQHA